MLDRNEFIYLKSQPKPEFKWWVDGNFEAKNTIKGVSDETFSTLSRLMLKQHHPTQCQNSCGFESETCDNDCPWSPGLLPAEISWPDKLQLFYLLTISRDALQSTDKLRESTAWMPCTLAVQIILLSTYTTKWHNFQLLLFPRNFSSSPETSLFLTWPQNLFFYFYYNSLIVTLFFVCTYKRHYLSLFSHIQLTSPNLALSLVSLVQNLAHHLATTSDTVHKDIWNFQVPNLEGRKSTNCYMLFAFHCFTHISSLPIVSEKQKSPPDFTGMIPFLVAVIPLCLPGRCTPKASFELFTALPSNTDFVWVKQQGEYWWDVVPNNIMA